MKHLLGLLSFLAFGEAKRIQPLVLEIDRALRELGFLSNNRPKMHVPPASK